jgi:hypothetical protein
MAEVAIREILFADILLLIGEYCSGVRLDDRRFGILGVPPDPGRPERIYKTRMRLNEISCLSKFYYVRSLSCNKAVVRRWRIK